MGGPHTPYLGWGEGCRGMAAVQARMSTRSSCVCVYVRARARGSAGVYPGSGFNLTLYPMQRGLYGARGGQGEGGGERGVSANGGGAG
jgi:hypothetical protein